MVAPFSFFGILVHRQSKRLQILLQKAKALGLCKRKGRGTERRGAGAVCSCQPLVHDIALEGVVQEETPKGVVAAQGVGDLLHCVQNDRPQGLREF